MNFKRAVLQLESEVFSFVISLGISFVVRGASFEKYSSASGKFRFKITVAGFLFGNQKEYSDR